MAANQERTGPVLYLQQSYDMQDKGQAESSAQGAARSRVITSHRLCTACEGLKHYVNFTRAPCGHEYCDPCLRKLFTTAMRNNGPFPPRCCRQVIPAKPNRIALGLELYTEYQDKSVEILTRNKTYCHRPECSHFLRPGMIQGRVGLIQNCKKSSPSAARTNGSDAQSAIPWSSVGMVAPRSTAHVEPGFATIAVPRRRDVGVIEASSMTKSTPSTPISDALAALISLLVVIFLIRPKDLSFLTTMNTSVQNDYPMGNLDTTMIDSTWCGASMMFMVGAVGLSTILLILLIILLFSGLSVVGGICCMWLPADL
ncbi:hypothetical protein F5Y18DRAFT_426068 [Xylariaceae sp. FL1019]|nr:hypothetical protein F5Y18DRAFT_426068 [Xylariaceae sp. FL1019]